MWQKNSLTYVDSVVSQITYHVLAEWRSQSMIDTEIFNLLYTHLEKRTVNSVRDHLNSDTDNQEAIALECEFFQKYESIICLKNSTWLLNNGMMQLPSEMPLTLP